MSHRPESNRLHFKALAAGDAPAPPEAPKPKIRCGVIGIDHAHALDVIETLQKSPDFELAGICEPDNAVREKLQNTKLFAGVRWLSQSELLNDPTIKMVAAESAVPRLLALGRDVIDADKHLHLDKPAGASLPEFRALLDEAERRKRIVQMGYMFRYNPGFDLVRQAFSEGRLGDVYAIHATMCTDIADKDKRRRLAFHPGGIFFDLGSHLIDMVVLLLGPPEKVTPFLRHNGNEQDGLADNALVVFEYNHTLVTIEVTAMEPDAFPTRRFKIAGELGAIILEPLEPPSARVCLRGENGGKTTVRNVKLDDLPRHARDFADLALCVRGEKEFPYTKDHDYNVQRTLLQACGIKTQ